MPVAIPLIAGGAALAGSAISAGATSKASKAATDANTASLAAQQDVFNQNKALQTPFIQTGQQANDLLSSFIGVNGDPAKAKSALDTYINSTGYKFQLDQGVGAITGNRAAAGLLDSGGTLKALDSYGQKVASTYVGDWESRLADVANRGESAAGSLSGTGTNYANAVGNINSSTADTIGNAAMAGAGNTNSLINNLVGSLAIAKGKSSYGDVINPNSTSAAAAAAGWL